MTVWSETHRQSEAARAARYPSPVTGAALIARHAAAAQSVIAYRAQFVRALTLHGYHSAQCGIALHHFHTATNALATTRRLLAAGDVLTRAAAAEAELSICEDTVGDAATLAARDHHYARLIQPYADMVRAAETRASLATMAPMLRVLSGRVA